MRIRQGAVAAFLGLMPGLLLAGDAGFASYSNDILAASIRQGSFTDISSVVRSLPEFLRSNLTFVFESFSAQEAHLPEPPRAILWDTQGKFFLAFNGDARAGGFGSIETLEFDETKTVPVFRFSGVHQGNVPGSPFTPVDEKRCSDCHGQKARPIWGEYPTWRGVYGSREDIMQPEEKDSYERFRAGALTSSLYGPLIPSDAWPNFPYKKDSDVNVMSESHTFKYRPNTRMSILLNRLNAKRVLALIRAASTYRSDRAQLAHAFLGCGDDKQGSALLLKYGLSMRDIDLRYPYYDPAYESILFSDSYFDGASTFNELMAAAIVSELAQEEPAIAPIRYNTLVQLYSSNYHRHLDGEFLAAADNLGNWIRTPFPEIQHKTKLRPRPNAAEIANVRELCSRLEALSGKSGDQNGGAAKAVTSQIPFATIRQDVIEKGECLKCHTSAHGNPGGINLEGYESVRKNASLILGAVESDYMPLGGAPLELSQKKLLRAWIEQGMPQGNSAK